MGMKVHIAPHALFKLRQLITNCSYEISGVGEVILHEGEPLVTDIFIMEQTGAGAETDLTPEGQQALLEAILRSGRPTENMRLWWHSHARMNAFMSGTDVNTINMLGPTMDEGWLLAICGNHRGDWFARLDTFSPFRLTVEKLEVVEYKGDIKFEAVDDFSKKYLEMHAEIEALYTQIAEKEALLIDPIKLEIKEKVKEKTYQSYSSKDYRGNYGHGRYQSQMSLVDPKRWPNCAGCKNPNMVHNHNDGLHRNKYKCSTVNCKYTSSWTKMGHLMEEDWCPGCNQMIKPHHSEFVRQELKDERFYPYHNYYSCQQCQEHWSDLAMYKTEHDQCPKCHMSTAPWKHTERDREEEKSKEVKPEDHIRGRKQSKLAKLMSRVN